MTQHLAQFAPSAPDLAWLAPPGEMVDLPVYEAQPMSELPHPGPRHGFRYISESDTEYDDSVVKSAHRTIRVFEYFSEYRRPACAIEIASELGMPQSSASMLLRSLVSIGYLSQLPGTRSYVPTHRLSLLCGWQREQVGIAERLSAIAAELHAETGECVLVAEQYRHFVRYVHVLQSADPDKVLRIPLGTLRPIASTAFGQVLLAQKPDREVRALLHRARADRGSKDHGLDLTTALDAVRRVQADGFACTSRLLDALRTFQIAAPVRDCPGLAIGIASYGTHFTERSAMLLEHVRRHAGAMPDWSVHADSFQFAER